MRIRQTENGDLPALMALYDQARAFMRAKGNPNQWPDGYPPLSLLEADIAQGHSYVLEDETGQLVGTFALIGGQDPTYGQIDGLGWRSTSPYVTLHRLAANGKARGVARAAFDFAKSVCPTSGLTPTPKTCPCSRPSWPTVSRSEALSISKTARPGRPMTI